MHLSVAEKYGKFPNAVFRSKMITVVNPKLPMRNIEITRDFYVNNLGFTDIGNPSFRDYLMVVRDKIELHFFAFPELEPTTNYGQVYIRTNDIKELYLEFIENKIPIHPNGPLQLKPWGQIEFSILDPDNNLLTFGERAGL